MSLQRLAAFTTRWFAGGALAVIGSELELRPPADVAPCLVGIIKDHIVKVV